MTIKVRSIVILILSAALILVQAQTTISRPKDHFHSVQQCQDAARQALVASEKRDKGYELSRKDTDRLFRWCVSKTHDCNTEIGFEVNCPTGTYWYIMAVGKKHGIIE